MIYKETSGYPGVENTVPKIKHSQEGFNGTFEPAKEEITKHEDGVNDYAV